MPLNLDARSDLEKALKSLRPKSCGRDADIPAFIRWKVYHQQLWRFTSYDAPIIPFKPIVLGDHTTPPRVRDTVQVGDKVAHITHIDYGNREAHVWFHNESKPGSFDLDALETNRGKVRWIVH